MSPALIDRTAEVYGHLTVLRRTDNNKHGQTLWECLCDCGVLTVVTGQYLRSGHTRSCGCLKGGKKSHGMARTPEHVVWCRIKTRVSNPNCKDYPDYGGRGIDMDPEWFGSGGFEKFFAHIGPKPDPTYSIDRIDNDKGYWPGNVRWADAKTQANNRRVRKDASK